MGVGLFLKDGTAVLLKAPNESMARHKIKIVCFMFFGLVFKGLTKTKLIFYYEKKIDFHQVLCNG
jgi:hypothetical protein